MMLRGSMETMRCSLSLSLAFRRWLPGNDYPYCLRKTAEDRHSKISLLTIVLKRSSAISSAKSAFNIKYLD